MNTWNLAQLYRWLLIYNGVGLINLRHILLFSQFNSVQFRSSVMSDSLWPMDSKNTRPLCPSSTPGVYSNSCSFSRWCHPTISSSVIPFPFSIKFFSASEPFQKSQLFPSGVQSIGVSASASVLLMNIQDWYSLGWTGWISLQSKGLSRVSPTPQLKSISSSLLSFLYTPTLTSIHDYWITKSFKRWVAC